VSELREIATFCTWSNNREGGEISQKTRVLLDDVVLPLGKIQTSRSFLEDVRNEEQRSLSSNMRSLSFIVYCLSKWACMRAKWVGRGEVKRGERPQASSK
jgi:hypothetical protein